MTADEAEAKIEIQSLKDKEKATAAAQEFRVVPTLISERPTSVMILIDKGLSDVSGSAASTYGFLPIGS